MCIALHIFGDQNISIADLERMDTDNPHGIGIAYLDPDTGKIRIRKGLSLKELAWLQPDLPRPFLLHFRWATIGPKVPALAHPFALGINAFSTDLDQQCEAALIHNGGWVGWRGWTLPDGIKESNVSDTQVAAYVIGAGHPEIRKDVSWSNAIIMRREGKAVVSEHGRWTAIPGMAGVSASNLSWQTRARGAVFESPYGKWHPGSWVGGKWQEGHFERNSRSQSYYDSWDQDITPIPTTGGKTAPLMAGLVSTGVHSGHVAPHPNGIVTSPTDRRTIPGVDGRTFKTPWCASNRAPFGSKPCADCGYYSCVCGYSDQTCELAISRRVSGLDPDRGAPLYVADRIALGYLPIDATPLNADSPPVVDGMTHKQRKALVARNRSSRRTIRKEAERTIKAITACPEGTAKLIRTIAEVEIRAKGIGAPIRIASGKYQPPVADRGCTAGICYCPSNGPCPQSLRLAAIAEASDGDPVAVELDAFDEINYRDPLADAHKGPSFVDEYEAVQRALALGNDRGWDQDDAISFEQAIEDLIDPVPSDPEYGRGVETWDMGGEGG